jgi:hypothetical protein
MTGQKIKVIISFITLGLILTMSSCKIKKEETPPGAGPVDHSIRLSDAQIQLANINIASAREGSIGRQLSLTGVLKVNEQSAASVSSRSTGRIENYISRIPEKQSGKETNFMIYTVRNL